jgi:outer membrane protein OmpU
MKKLLLASAAVVGTAGYAAADVEVTGTAFMGVSNNGAYESDGDLRFTSRLRIIFTASGETDGGLTFGGSVRNDQSGVGLDSNGDSTVFVSGAFGKVTFGDNDTAANAIVGHVDAKSLHDLGCEVDAGGDCQLGNPQELGYLGQTDTSVLYTYSMDALTFAASTGQVGNDEYSVAAKYATDAFSVALGYEEVPGDTQMTLGASTTFNDITLKVVAADRDSWDETRYAVSAAGTFSGVGFAVFYADHGERFFDNNGNGVFNAANDVESGSAWGIGASYDLGGGASIVGGVKKNENFDAQYDLGVSMTF